MDKSGSAKNNIFFLFLMLISMFLWGGSWVSGKLSVLSAPATLIVFWRFFVTFISFIPVIFILRLPLKINRSALLLVFLGGAILFIYNICFFVGLHYGFAGAGGVIVTTLNSLITFLLSSLIFKKGPAKRELIGLIIGLLGGAILLELWHFELVNLVKSGNLFFLAAAALWAFLSFTAQRSKDELHPFVFSFYLYGLTSLIALLASGVGGVIDPVIYTLPFWINIGYLAVGATTFATTAYFFAAAHIGAGKASSFIFLVPGSAVLLSWLILKEKPTAPTLIGGAMALAAVYIINLKQIAKKS